jgi:chromosome segregation ATPase
LLGRLPTRLTTVDALTAAQGELAQTRAELGRMAKAAAEARTRLSVIELNLSRLREENDRLRLDNKALEVELNAALAAAPQS